MDECRGVVLSRDGTEISRDEPLLLRILFLAHTVRCGHNTPVIRLVIDDTNTFGIFSSNHDYPIASLPSAGQKLMPALGWNFLFGRPSEFTFCTISGLGPCYGAAMGNVMVRAPMLTNRCISLLACVCVGVPWPSRQWRKASCQLMVGASRFVGFPFCAL